ncbi:MAG: dihydroorotate dehydrogenase electron transfer subunit [Clostridia bacterium]|nr:dihydroorotate dehydrogenase electron transfer subunit [Clostridia bacterium]
MICELIAKKSLPNSLCDFVVRSAEMAAQTKPGQFLHILCGGDAYLRRPISVCEVSGDTVRFIFQVRGVGTDALSNKKVGEKLDILGPLGTGFDLTDCGNRPVLIGGGIGIFPLLEVAKKLGKSASVLLGFKSEADVILTEEFAKYTDKVFVATDDGSCGFKGLVTDLARNIAKSNDISSLYTCGPMPMMRAVTEVAKEFNIPAQASLEERMGCGVGACVTCACTVAGQRKRVCKDGPVFNALEVEWDG